MGFIRKMEVGGVTIWVQVIGELVTFSLDKIGHPFVYLGTHLDKEAALWLSTTLKEAAEYSEQEED